MSHCWHIILSIADLCSISYDRSSRACHLGYLAWRYSSRGCLPRLQHQCLGLSGLHSFNISNFHCNIDWRFNYLNWRLLFSSVQCLSTFIQFSAKCSTVIGAAKCLCLINEPQCALKPHVSVSAYNTKCYNVYMLNCLPVDIFITDMLLWVSERPNCM